MTRAPVAAVLSFLSASCLVPTGAGVYYGCDGRNSYCDADGGLRVDGGAVANPDGGAADAGCGGVPGADDIDPRWALGGARLETFNSSGTLLERVFAIGGNPASGTGSTEVQFEEAESSQAWHPAGQLLTARAYFATVVIPPLEGIVVLGGLGPDGGLDSMENFSIQLAPAPGTTWLPGGPALPAPTYGHAAVFLGSAITGGMLLSCGGFRAGGTSADCDTLGGREITNGQGTSFYWDDAGWQQNQISMWKPRTFFSMVIGPDGRAYAIGGGETTPTSRTWEVFDSSNSSWMCPGICAKLTAPRVAAAAAVGGTRIYVIGGHADTADLTGSDSVEYIDLDAGPSATWQPAGNLTQGRWGHAAVTLHNGHIRVMGGIDNGCVLGSVEDYDPGNNEWTPVTGS